MALVYAARFPRKVRRLVLAGAPVDIAAGQSQLSQMTVQLPLAAFEEFVGSQGGRVLGQRVLQIWGTALIADDSRRVLQLAPDDNSRGRGPGARFEEWYDLTVDLPGTYYLQVVSWLYQQNRLATGNFVALGRKIDLTASITRSSCSAPATTRSSPPGSCSRPRTGSARRRKRSSPSPNRAGISSLFLGAETIRGTWPRIARWLSEE